MHHVFDVDIATRFGVNAAIILENLNFWIQHNKANDKCFAEGRWWTYNSVKAFSVLYPYMSEQGVRTALQKLIDGGVVVKGNFSRTQDRTTWYAITEKGFRLLEHCPVEEDDEPTTVEENPFGEWDDSGVPDTAESYAAKNLSRLSPGNMQEFGRYKAVLGEEVIRHAIDISCRNGASVWGYTRKILDRYIERGFKNLDDVLVDEGKKQQRRMQQSRETEGENPLLKTKFY